MIVAIHQPNFAPWLGYFDKIASCNKFVLLDHVQVPKQSVANRNFIKGKNGQKVLLTVPLKKNTTSFTYHTTSLDYASNWPQKHLNKIYDAYYQAPFFTENIAALEVILKQEYISLSMLNEALLKFFLSILDIKTQLLKSSEMDTLQVFKSELNLSICKQLNASNYLSGSGAKKYNDEKLYLSNNINLVYQNYTPIQYQQLHGEFIENLSFIDLLFNEGKQYCKELFLNKKDVIR